MPQTMATIRDTAYKPRPIPPVCYEHDDPVGMVCRGHGLLADGRKIRYYYCPICGRSAKRVKQK